jgi:uncharacterized protein YecE (DUF72 family)
VIRIGTSGWTYKHWKGSFYPEGTPQRRWLEYYAGRFDTVELNASFYHIPKAATVRGWAARTPAGFRFAVKVSRLVTHVHRLVDCRDPIEWFFRELEPLKDKVAAYLLQLPPSLTPSVELLESFFPLLPAGYRYVLELRNEQTYSGSIPELLEKHGITFCIHDLRGRETPLRITSKLVYVRFHGANGRYSGSYSDEALRQWAERLRSWSSSGREVLVYFNNDVGGHAVRNAETLRRLLAG